MTASYSAEQSMKAWQTLEDLALRLSNASFKGLRAIFTIGSLPGGYFRPSQSDLDVVVLFNDPPRSGNDLEDLKAGLDELIQPKKLLHPFEVECMPRFISDLGRNPESGLLQNPDLVARLKVQSKQLFGNYPVQTLPMPSATEWAWETRNFLRWWDLQTAADPTRSTTPSMQIKKTLALVRFYLAVRRDLVEYNKFKLLEVYDRAIPVVPISLGTRLAIQSFLNDGVLNQPAAERLERELPVIQQALTEAIL